MKLDPKVAQYARVETSERLFRELMTFGRPQVADNIPSQTLTSDAIYKGQVIAKDFRTAPNVGQAGGPAGIRFNGSEIAGYSAGTTKEFYLQSSDGKAYFGGGTVVADATGLHIIDSGTATQYGIFYGDAAWVYLNSTNGADLSISADGGGGVINLACASLTINSNATYSGTFDPATVTSIVVENGLIKSVS